MHHQLAKCAVIVVIILFIRGVFSTQPMFQSMEPTGACQVYILPRHQATSIFDKKIWRKKNQDCEIFWEAIYCIINRLPLDETGKHGPFPVITRRRTCLECAKIIYPLVY